jgi:hypothetical protein
MWMQIWAFLHIATMFAAVTITFGGAWFVVSAARRRDLGALRAYHRIAGPAEGLAGILAITGIGFGVVAAIAGGWDLFQGWLLLAFILVGVAIVVGIASVPFANRLLSAVERTEGDKPGPELEGLLASRQVYGWPIASFVVVILLIADMVFKPQF